MRELGDWERRFNCIFGRPTWGTAMEETDLIPAIDVFEKDGNFVVKAELPGMKEEGIDVSVTDSTLMIKGEKKTESEDEGADYYRCERSYGSFYRSIPLPNTVDDGNIKADFEDGILEVTVPKMETAKPKKVAVSTKKTASTKSKAKK